MQKHSHGFTLIELLMVLAIAAILLGVATPALTSMISGNRVSGAAEQIKSEVEWARSEAIKNNNNISLNLTTGTSWCIGLEAASGDGICDCASTNCLVSGQVKTLGVSDFSGTRLTTTIASDKFDLDSSGILSGEPGNIVISNSSVTATLRISRLGRASICSADIGKYPAC